MEQRRAFSARQLTTTQGNIRRAKTSLAEKQTALGREASTRGVLDLQDEIKALELKIEGWQKTYAALLGSVEGEEPGLPHRRRAGLRSRRPRGPNASQRADGARRRPAGHRHRLLIECVINGNRLSLAPTSRASSTSNLGSIGAAPRRIWAPSA